MNLMRLTKMKLFLLKYCYKAYYISLFVGLNYLMSFISPPPAHKELPLLMTLLLFPALSFMIIMIISLVEMLIYRYKYETPGSLFFDKKFYFRYKDDIYFTTYSTYVIIYKVKFLRYYYVGQIDNSDNVEEYQNDLKNTIDNYTERDIKKRLEKRKLKFKFKQFNNL